MENTNNNQQFEMRFPPEIYNRAKEAKDEVFAFVEKVKKLGDPNDFDDLIKAVSHLPEDQRIVIGLGRFSWNKGMWDFDAPPTRNVMQRMTNRQDPEKQKTAASDYYEVHIRYDEYLNEDKAGFYRHSISHSIYSGNYIPSDGAVNDVE